MSVAFFPQQPPLPPIDPGIDPCADPCRNPISNACFQCTVTRILPRPTFPGTLPDSVPPISAPGSGDAGSGEAGGDDQLLPFTARTLPAPLVRSVVVVVAILLLIVGTSAIRGRKF